MSAAAKELESSGGLVNYYLAPVKHPQREAQPPYTAECEDIIDSLGLTPDEANIFKEIWRTANERTHGKGKAGNNPLRAAQKMVHYSGRILRKAQQAALDVIQQCRAAEEAEPGMGDDWVDMRNANDKPRIHGNTALDVVDQNGQTYYDVSASAVEWSTVKRWRRSNPR